MKACIKYWMDLIRTILAVIELSEGGFRITKAHNDRMGTDMYRFWWHDEMLPQHGDITHLGPKMWSSMLNGGALRLDLLLPGLGRYYRRKQKS